MTREEVIKFSQTLEGWCSEEKAAQLYDLVIDGGALQNEMHIVELGAFGGRSFIPMAVALNNLNKKGHATAIDAWDNVTPLEGTNAPANNDYWATVPMDRIFKQFRYIVAGTCPNQTTILKMRSDEAAAKFEDNSLDILHQDSNHNVETITKELELWAPKLKIGGFWIADDINWVEAKEGYAKLPSFGFELIADFETWAIYKKTGKTNYSFDKEIIEKKLAQFRTVDTGIVYEVSAMKFDNHNIKPILMYLPDEKIWEDEHIEATKYLAEIGITGVEHIAGVHAKKWGIQGRHIYLVDAKPEEQFYIGDGKVGGFLTKYIAYCCMNVMNYSHFLVMETDVRFVEGWKEKLEQALKDVPQDFDILFVGSCCCAGKEPVHIKGDVYEFPWRGKDKWDWYPMCEHCIIFAKKAMPVLIQTQRDVASPSDVSLVQKAFPNLKVYAILPRIADQGVKTKLPE